MRRTALNKLIESDGVPGVLLDLIDQTFHDFGSSGEILGLVADYISTLKQIRGAGAFEDYKPEIDKVIDAFRAVEKAMEKITPLVGEIMPTQVRDHGIRQMRGK